MCVSVCNVYDDDDDDDIDSLDEGSNGWTVD